MSTHDINSNSKQFKAPTFNIHIHVPPCSTNTSKFHVPHIQPVIHLHFDEIINWLEINKNQLSDEILARTFKNLLDATLPKFGNVQFHFDNKLNDSDTQKTDNISVSSSSEFQCYDEDFEKKEDIEKIQKGISKNTESVTNISNIHESNNKNNDRHKVPFGYELDEDLKLKNAVVVLKDISKNKAYRNAITEAGTKSSILFMTNVNDSSYDILNIDRNHQINKTVLKQENGPSISEVFAENESDVFHQSTVDTCCNLSTTKSLDTEFENEKTPERKSTLTALAEGYDFSKILSKFKINYHKNLVDSLNVSHSTTTSRSNIGIKNIKEKLEEKKNCIEGYYKNGVNFNSTNMKHTNFSNTHLDIDSILFDGNVSSEQVINTSTLSYFEDINKSIKTEQSLSEQNIKQGFRFCTRDKTVSVVDSDEFETTETISEKGLSSKQNVTFVDTVEPHLSSFLFKPVVNKIDAHVMYKEIPGFEEKFADNYVTTKKKHVSESMESCSSSPKKMKHSEEKDKTSSDIKMESSSPEDYILLDSSGPTEFAITPLNKIQPFKKHPAKNFKNEMLYGNRVKRFSSPHYLQMCKAKNALRKSWCN